MATIPYGDRVVVDRRKIAGYLLSSTHQVGRCKSPFLRSLGFSAEHPEILESELKRIACEASNAVAENTGFGTRYIADATLIGPSAQSTITTVWIVDSGSEVPRLVAIYPAEMKA